MFHKLFNFLFAGKGKDRKPYIDTSMNICPTVKVRKTGKRGHMHRAKGYTKGYRSVTAVSRWERWFNGVLYLRKAPCNRKFIRAHAKRRKHSWDFAGSRDVA